MLDLSADAMTLATRFVAEVEKRDIHIQRAILFGSHAKGKAEEWSDIDIALVSDDFEGMRFNDRRKLTKPLLAVDCRIEALPYRPEDFTEDDLFVKEILETGVRIV